MKGWCPWSSSFPLLGPPANMVVSVEFKVDGHAFSLKRYLSSTLYLLLRVHSQKDSHVSLHNCQCYMTQSHFSIGQCLPEQPLGTCLLLWHSWFCARPRDLLNCFYVSSKGYRKLECGRIVVPFFPGTLLLSLFCPATIGHAKKSLPLLALLRSKWEGGMDLYSCAVMNSTE